jgi:hypothetical protein
MCGTGRYLLPLLAHGFDVEGMDCSDEMLFFCRLRAQTLHLTPTLHTGYLEKLSLNRAFGLVYIPSGSFSLLTDIELVKASLSSVYATLAPGGTFVVEVERAGVILPSQSGTWEGRWLYRTDGSKIIQSWLRQYSGVEAIARHIHRYELVTDGRLVATEFEDFSIKHYEPDEFDALLGQAGFTRIRCYKPYTQLPIDVEDEGLMFECRKP